MKTKNSGLGSGLDALFGNSDLTDIDINSKSVEEISIDLIYPNPDQPRKAFDETALRELALSIENVGILSPLLLVRKNDKFMIIAGERRYRASIIAGLKKLPALVRDLSDRECKEIALIENLQREDLNPIEEATAMRALLEEFNMSQDELAKRLGKSRPVVTNTLRLLTLHKDVIILVRDGRLSAGHARAIATIKDPAVQLKYALAACDKKMSVRELELMVNAYINPQKTSPKKKIKLSAELKELVNDMQHVFATKIKAVGTEEKGRIYIDYYTKDDLQRIYDVINSCQKKK